MRWFERLFFGLLLGVAVSSAHAWSRHAIGTWQALNALPEVRSEPLVKVEPLSGFLKDQGPALEGLLQQEEQWARGHVRNYPARPEVLAYRHDKDADASVWVLRFLNAVRANPHMPLPLYLQLQPTPHVLSENHRPGLTWQDVSLYKEPSLVDTKFVALREAEWVAVLDVIATASDEPDYGLDIGLWENNATEFGRIYGFGKQPLGDPKHPASSQASFHSGYFHESPLAYAASGSLRRTFPEYRMHLWQTLARHAMLSGHPYWGWRFAGWAMHYAQDLTQPYHATMLPGHSVMGMVWDDVLAITGTPHSKDERLHQMSERHAALESFHQQSLLAALHKGEFNHPNLLAFANLSKDQGRLVLTEFSLREDVSKSAHASAEALDALMLKAFPMTGSELANHIQSVNLYSTLAQHNPNVRDALDKQLRDLSGNFGRVTRAIWRRLR
jgi:hypothetical protein